jgi:hypothetical protein
VINTTVTIGKLLSDLRRAGASFSVAGDRLSYVAPAGLITTAVVDTLRARKAELLAVLRGDYLNAAAAALVFRVPDCDRRNDLAQAFDERAGICQYDGNLSRAEAERTAYIELAKVLLDE